MRKPARKVRRYMHRSKGKGKGDKGKGKWRYHILDEMTDEDVDHVFFGGKGKSKGKRRSSGKGKGRRQNPRGQDGHLMTCGICQADDHLRAQCPRRPPGGHHSGFGGFLDVLAEAGSADGPLSDLAGLVVTGDDVPVVGFALSARQPPGLEPVEPLTSIDTSIDTPTRNLFRTPPEPA